MQSLNIYLFYFCVDDNKFSFLSSEKDAMYRNEKVV